MNQLSPWRHRARHALEAYFRQHSFPRFTLGILILLTGYIGFGISFGLLRFGISEMWIRYPIAVLGAYGSFLGLMRLWVEIERRRFDFESFTNQALLGGVPPEKQRPAKPVSDSTTGTNWLDGLDLPLDLFDGDAAGMLLIFLVALVAFIALLAFTLLGGTSLLEELFLDTFLMAFLYRRLRVAARQHWLGTAIRKTWLLAVLTAILLGIVGACLQELSPESPSIGPAVRHLLERSRDLPQ